MGLTQLALDPDKLIASFEHYLAQEGTAISRAAAEQRMLEKLNRSLTEDVEPLLPIGITFTESSAIAAFGKVWGQVITRLKGEPWRLSRQTIERIREMRYPTFLERIAE